MSVLARPDTPCRGICSHCVGDEQCRGCWRTVEEARDWNTYSARERAMVRELARLRRETHRLAVALEEATDEHLRLAGALELQDRSDWKLCTACRALHPRSDFDPAHPDFPTRDGLQQTCRTAAAAHGYRLRRLPDGKVEEA